MYEPTEYISENISASCSLREDDAAFLESLIQSRVEIYNTLTDLRKSKFMDYDSVFDISMEDVEEVLQIKNIPESQKEIAKLHNDSLWDRIYTSIIYKGEARREAVKDVSHSNAPKSNSIKFYEKNIEFNNDVLLIHTPDKTVSVFPNSNIGEYYDPSWNDGVRIVFHSEEAQIIGDLVGVEFYDVEISLTHDANLRRYQNRKKENEIRDELSTIEGLNPRESDSDLELFLNICSEVYGAKNVLKIILYLQEKIDSCWLDYGYFTPKFTWEVANSLGTNTLHLPQEGYIVFGDKKPSDKLQNIPNTFPENQSLTREEWEEFFNFIGFTGNYEATIDGIVEFVNIFRGNENLANLYTSNQINKREMDYYNLSPLFSNGERQVTFEVISHGKDIYEMLEHLKSKSEYKKSVNKILQRTSGDGRIRWWN